LSPFQFNPVLEAVMALGLNNTEAGIKLNGELMNNLQFVDDIALLTKSISKLQGITTQQSRTVENSIDVKNVGPKNKKR